MGSLYLLCYSFLLLWVSKQQFSNVMNKQTALKSFIVLRKLRSRHLLAITRSFSKIFFPKVIRLSDVKSFRTVKIFGQKTFLVPRACNELP